MENLKTPFTPQNVATDSGIRGRTTPCLFIDIDPYYLSVKTSTQYQLSKSFLDT